MPVVDLYGRNPDVERSTFHYATGPLVMDQENAPVPGARYFFKPPESSPVIGAQFGMPTNAEDTHVFVDPTNAYYRRSSPSISGLGGTRLGADLASPSSACEEMAAIEPAAMATLALPSEQRTPDGLAALKSWRVWRARCNQNRIKSTITSWPDWLQISAGIVIIFAGFKLVGGVSKALGG